MTLLDRDRKLSLNVNIILLCGIITSGNVTFVALLLDSLIDRRTENSRLPPYNSTLRQFQLCCLVG